MDPSARLSVPSTILHNMIFLHIRKLATDNSSEAADGSLPSTAKENFAL